MSGTLAVPAGVVGSGLARRAVQNGIEDGADFLASKSVSLYNPPSKSARPFSADYPHGGVADEAGNLRFDIEGRPLVAEYVVGRRMVGEADQGLSPTQIQSVGERSVGARYQSVPPGALKGNAGLLRMQPTPELTLYDVLLNKNLAPEKLARVSSHETGHLIDELAGQIPTAGLITELRQVYNTLNTGQERTRHLTGPQLGQFPQEQTATVM